MTHPAAALATNRTRARVDDHLEPRAPDDDLDPSTLEELRSSIGAQASAVLAWLASHAADWGAGDEERQALADAARS